jgi:peptide/nickel transport system permease protein
VTSATTTGRIPVRGRPGRTTRVSRGENITFIVATTLLAVMVLVGLLGPFLPLGDPRETIGDRFSPPGAIALFGTDELGRSVLARIVEGIRLTFLLPTFGVLIALLIGGSLGVVAAFVGGAFDDIVSRTADVLSAFPAILIAILFAVTMGPGSPSAVSAIAWAVTPPIVRIARAAAIAVVHQDYVVSAKVAGVRTPSILTRHVLPNIAGPLIVQSSYAVSLGMILESGLSFIGLGVQAPSASLGSLASLGSPYITAAPWLAFVPGGVLAVAIVAVNLVGNGLRLRLDPLQGRVTE